LEAPAADTDTPVSQLPLPSQHIHCAAMGYQEVLVYVVIAFLMVFLYKEWLRPTVTFMLAIVALMVGQVIAPEEALHGFGNEQLAVIVLLLILSGIFQKMTFLESAFSWIMKKGDSFGRFQVKTLFSMGLISAFMNNTPLVAMYMPPATNWMKAHKVPLSRIMIPLSYASILGGCITLIGTSTNLIVNGLAIEYGYPSLDMFDFTLAGLPLMVIGLLYLIILNRKILPIRKAPGQEMRESDREYFIETIVQPDSPLVGRSIEEAALRNLKGLFLVEIIRRGKVISPVSPGEVLEPDDVLLFAGDPNAISDLTKPKTGLALPKAAHLPEGQDMNVVELVLANNPRIVGEKVKDTDFRGRYDGAILAIHRNGERLQGKIGDQELQTGDVLLVLAGKDFFIRVRNNPGFYVLSQRQEEKPIGANWKSLFLSFGFITAIVLSFFDVQLMISLSVLLSASILLDLIKPSEIRNLIDFNLILIIVFGLALGKAMISSGAALRIAGLLENVPPGSGAVLLLVLVYVVNNLLASIMTSKAAVAITLPVALTVAGSHHLDPEPFILAVAFSGAANFITPFGYQTNLMVYGPGGYKFGDFMRAGLPLTIISTLVICFVLSLTYGFI
jgi:di/tricarboxylate transporter